MTEQLYNTNYQNAIQLNNQLTKAAGAEQTPENLAAQTQANMAQVELKAKRIRALRSKLRPFSIGICFFSKKSWFKRFGF
jgi:hypothetical protein